METNLKTWTWLTLFVLIWISPTLSQDTDNCAFEATGTVVSSCTLLMDNTKFFSVANWRTGTGKGSNWIGGPTIDNANSTEGGYAFTSTTDMFESNAYHKKTWMLTRPRNSTGAGGRCLSFAYAIDGLSLKNFEILLINYEVEDPMEIMENANRTDDILFQQVSLWKRSEATGGKWVNGRVTYTALRQHSIAFAASPEVRFSHSRAYVAVDDITFIDGPCAFECMFDQDTCTWTQEDTDDDFDWSLGRSSTKRGTGPSRDQASSLNDKIVTGGYAFIDSGYPRRSGDTARLVSGPINITSSPVCISFWLNMHGGGIGDIRLLYATDQSPNITKEVWKLWAEDGANSFGTDNWYPCQQTVSSTEDFRLIFEASVGFPGASDIAIDTISFTERSCPSSDDSFIYPMNVLPMSWDEEEVEMSGFPAGSSAGWGDCTFLDDLCGWTMPFSDSNSCRMLDRVAENSYNPPGHTESPYEVTDMYIKFDLGCYLNRGRDRSALISAPFTSDTVNCLSFWVLMYTTVATTVKFGSLSVVLIDGGTNKTIWRMQNQQQATWTYAQVPVPRGSQLKIAFEGTKGPNVIGMIGVDDVAVFPSNCKVEPPIANVEPGDCTFDSGPCLYQIQNAISDSASPAENWQFAVDGELSSLRDHTFEADLGGFMFMDSFNTVIRSRLRSPPLPVNQTYCFTFYYASVYVDPNAKLSVYRDPNGVGELIWQFSPPATSSLPGTTISPGSYQEGKWHFAQVQLENQDARYHVYIEGEVRDGGWAVDDVKLFRTTGECKTRPEAASPDYDKKRRKG